jgi:hypothetical protein
MLSMHELWLTDRGGVSRYVGDAKAGQVSLTAYLGFKPHPQTEILAEILGWLHTLCSMKEVRKAGRLPSPYTRFGKMRQEARWP